MVLPSKPSAVVQACKEILNELHARKYSQQEVFAVHLALEEAFINAVNHGNKKNPRKQVRVKYSIADDKVVIEMADQGNGFQSDNVPDPRCGENIYKTDGRGIFLMRAYMDKVEFNRRGNRVRMIKYRENDKKIANAEQ